MPTYCSACRKSLSPGDLECRWCGLPLTAMAMPAAITRGQRGQRGFPAFGRLGCFQKATADPWSESELQPRDEGDLQKYSPGRQSLCRTTAELLRRLAGQGDEAGYGSPHAGTQDRGDYVDTLEKRRKFRRRTSEIASSLSVYRTRQLTRLSYPMVSQSVSETLGVEGEYQSMS